LSYAELDAAADVFARRLAGAGVRPGDRVAALLPRGGAAVLALHGVPRTGAALVPLHPDWTEPELDDFLRRVRPRALLCTGGTEELAARLLRASGLLVRLGRREAQGDSADDGTGRAGAGGGPPAGGTGVDGEGDGGAGGRAVALGDLPAASAEVPGVDPEADHTVVSTSGTSGRPRGVRLTLANHLACQRAAARRLGLGPDDRWLASLSPAHVGGVALVVRAALTGARLVLRRAFDAGELLALAEEGRVTHASLVPTMLRRLLDARGDRPAPGGLEGLLLGGARAAPEMVERALEAGWPLCPTYGLTEAASQVATATPAEARERPGSAGRPLEGVEVRIDGDEILVRGPTVAAGYLGDRKVPGAVRREGRVIPRQGEPAPEGPGAADGPDARGGGAAGEPVTDEDGWLHTGDAGRLDDDGYLTVTGRLGDRIVSGGVTVDPREVERVLRAHPEVRDAAVVGVPDPEWGERVGALVERDPAAPEADPDDPLDATRLAAWFGERLAPAKRPRAVRFVEALPRNPNGKLDRGAARDLLSGG
jgi:O-succinylbenzoic acid--CoA ligase